MAASDLLIKGFLETSFLDWDGKIVSVVFLPNCNFRCPFCHNAALVLHPDTLAAVPVGRVIAFLKEHPDFIDGVCITGGEPALHAGRGLVEFIAELKKMNLLVKLDTNGTDPDLLERLYKDKMLDFVAMDVKGPLDKRYDKLSGVKSDLAKIKRSIGLIMDSGVDYEFRTTIVPNLLYDRDLEDLAKGIKGAKKFVLQQFDPRDTLDPSLSNCEPYPAEKLKEMAEIAGRYVKNIVIRGK